MAYHHNEATEEILDGVMNLPSIPKFGMILFPSNPSLQFVWEMFFNDKAECADILEELLSRRYLSLRTAPTTHDDYDLAKLFNMRNDDFKQAVRTTKDGFLWLLNQIRTHPIFYSNSARPQLPIPHQLALTFERLGSNGVFNLDKN
ncbi:uncharacterized protein PGTG_09821 [Puccinia graminis f. sp. tritici CRL 75-36-700-3]|uniref:Uncharacterized protein n=1 Tax=Puccinia graminis f. sp. tritici (strain CRL 75-36-700-3 / race SCCL) TaxID=418459 RepID=E3KF22_PUCGT|nr:uncharacterized protein PGTG_09821 [Puccinia graminis f. sp. tritici CRL 75-36-700-3]EFP82853.2 hypothetical protein PGTG_09821 [Puccinia graminis f. sp. tritici CRL 75-36-700-3]